MAQPTVSHWETGDLPPRMADLARLSAALAVPLGELAATCPVRDRRRAHRSDASNAGPSLGGALRLARLDAGLDPVGCARAARIAPRRLRRIEEGAEPSLAELDRVLAALGVASVDALAQRELDKAQLPPTVTGHRATTAAREPCSPSHEGDMGLIGNTISIVGPP